MIRSFVFLEIIRDSMLIGMTLKVQHQSKLQDKGKAEVLLPKSWGHVWSSSVGHRMRNLATCVPQVKLLVGLRSWLVWFHHAHTRLGTDWRWTGWLTGRWAGPRRFVLFLLHSILGLGTDLGFSEICCCWLQLLLLVWWLDYLAQACSDTARHSDSLWVTSSPDAADWPCLST